MLYDAFSLQEDMAAKSVTIRVSKKSYDYGQKSSLRVSKDAVIISDTEKNRTIEIPFRRWASLMRYMPDINESVRKFLANEFVQYKQHIGGAWSVSVTTGFPCVDIRKFYLPLFGFEEKPTKSGLAVRISEWPSFLAAAQHMHVDVPQLLQIQPCGDHQNQEDAMQCKECYPFPDVVFASRNM